MNGREKMAPNNLSGFFSCAIFFVLPILVLTERAYVLPRRFGDGAYKYQGCAPVGGEKVVCAPANAEKVLVLDAAKKKSYPVDGEDLGNSERKYLFCAPMTGGNVVLCPPYNANKVLAIDAAGDISYSLLSEDYGAGTEKYSSCVAVGKTMVCAPYNANKVLVIDIEKKESLMKIDGLEDSNGAKYRSCAAASKGKVVCAPYNATKILMIDTREGTSELWDLPKDYDKVKAGDNFLWNDCQSMDGGKVVCAPYDAKDILVIDADLQVSYTKAVTGLGSVRGKYHSCAKAGKKVLCAPGNAAKVLLIMHPEENTPSRLLSKDYGNNPEKYLTCVAADGERVVVCAPYNADSVLIIDAEKETSRLVTGDYKNIQNKYRGCVAASKDQIWCPPANAEQVLAISTPIRTTTTTLRVTDDGPGAGSDFMPVVIGAVIGAVVIAVIAIIIAIASARRGTPAPAAAGAEEKNDDESPAPNEESENSGEIICPCCMQTCVNQSDGFCMACGASLDFT